MYPVLALFLGDTPEINLVAGHFGGGKTKLKCGRCTATSENSSFSGFLLRLDKKEVTDKLFAMIVAKDKEVGAARDALKDMSTHDNFLFSDKVKHFDCSLCCPTCSLHVGRIGLTKTLFQLLGAVLFENCRTVVRKGKRDRELRDSDDLITCMNEQYGRFFPTRGGSGLFRTTALWILEPKQGRKCPRSLTHFLSCCLISFLRSLTTFWWRFLIGSIACASGSRVVRVLKIWKSLLESWKRCIKPFVCCTKKPASFPQQIGLFSILSCTLLPTSSCLVTIVWCQHRLLNSLILNW